MPKDRTGQALWQRRPADEEVGIRYPIWRVPARPPKQAIILSHDLIGCYTHYFGGRTTPCEGDECAACKANSTRRWHGWLLTKNVDSPAMGILELTAKATGPVDRYFRDHRTLRGALIQLCRSPQKPNGKVIAVLTDSHVDSSSLPAACDIREILMQMWEVSGRRSKAPPQVPEQHSSNQLQNGHTTGRLAVEHD